MTTSAGFDELRHTADWAMRVWAPDLPGLFSVAARAMNELSGIKLKAKPRISRTFEAAGTDTESLLVAFLSDLVFAAEQEKLAFDTFVVILRDGRLKVAMTGAPLESLTKPIKAVTYHNLQIKNTERGYEVEIVFDV
jgi:SHS2 domain-containing protein